MALHPEYIEKAYDRSIFRYLIDTLRTVAQSDGDQDATIVCDDVPFHLREVPKEALQRVLRRLTHEEHLCSVELEEFSHVKGKEKRISEDPAPSETTDTKPTKTEKRNERRREDGKPKRKVRDRGEGDAGSSDE